MPICPNQIECASNTQSILPSVLVWKGIPDQHNLITVRYFQQTEPYRSIWPDTLARQTSPSAATSCCWTSFSPWSPVRGTLRPDVYPCRHTVDVHNQVHHLLLLLLLWLLRSIISWTKTALSGQYLERTEPVIIASTDAADQWQTPRAALRRLVSAVVKGTGCSTCEQGLLN